MSVRFEAASSERASRASFFAADAIYTHGFWFYLDSLPGSGSASLYTLSAGSPSFNGHSLRVNAAGRLEIFSIYHELVIATGSTTLSTGTWYYCWVRKPGTGTSTNLQVYLDGVTTAEVSGNWNDFGNATLSYAYNPGGGGPTPANVRILNPKWWNTDVAASQANTEKASSDHQYTTGAYSEFLFYDTLPAHLADEGPGTRDLTATGTLSIEADPAGWTPPGGGGGSITVSFSGTAPAPTLAATVTHAAPSFPVSFAGSAPAPTLAAGLSHTPPVFEATFAGTAPLATLVATVAHAPPGFEVSFAGTAPAPTLLADVSHTPPSFPVEFAGTAPAPTLAATVTHAAPGITIGFAGTAPAPTLAATLGHTPPVFEASFAGVAPAPVLVATVTAALPGPIAFAGVAPLPLLAAVLEHTAPDRGGRGSRAGYPGARLARAGHAGTRAGRAGYPGARGAR